ncbi:MAG: hypothetical protein ACRDX8_04925 [Acidimicrobiales bacterium]
MLAMIRAFPLLVHRAVVLAAAATTGNSGSSALPGLSGITSLTGDMKVAGVALAGLAIMVGAATYAFTNHSGRYTDGTGHKVLMRACMGAGILGIATALPGFLSGLA